MRLIRRCMKAPKAKEIARRAIGAAGFGSGLRSGIKLQVVDRIGKARGCPQPAHDTAKCFVPSRDWRFCNIDGVLVTDRKIPREEQRVWFGQVQHIDKMLLAFDLGISHYAAGDRLIFFAQDKYALWIGLMSAQAAGT